MSIPTSGKQTPVYTEGGGIGIGLPVEASLRYGKTKMESCLFGCDRTTILPKAKSWMGNVVKSVTDQSEGQQVPADDPDVEYGPGGPGPRMEYLEPADTTSSMPQQSEAGGMCSSQSEPMTPYGPQE